MQGDGAVTTRRRQTGVNGNTVVAEVFDEFEAQQVAIEAERTVHVFDVDHGVVEGELAVASRSSGRLGGGLRRYFFRRKLLRNSLGGSYSSSLRGRLSELHCAPGLSLFGCFLRRFLRHTPSLHIPLVKRASMFSRRLKVKLLQ